MKQDILKDTFQRVRDGRVFHELYNTHQMMVRRCFDPDMKSYAAYGANGVTVTERWVGPDGFWNFVLDMGKRPEGTTLDRVDPFGDYTPENCRWANSRIQANNTRLQNSLNTSGCQGVHWCKRDNYWVSQITLNGKRTAIGRFSYEDFDMAQTCYLEAKRMKIEGLPDSFIYDEYITKQKNIGKKTKLRRNKTSQYWGVSYKASNDKWVASTDRYLGISDTEEGAYSIVLKWLEENRSDDGPSS